MTETRYQKLIQLHRAIYLFFGVGAIISGAISCIITKNFSSVYITIISIIALILISYGFYNKYSINIFKRKITIAYNAGNERELVYTLAFGLYSVVIVALIYASVFILLQVFNLSAVIAAGIISGELALFCAIGYLSSIQLRKNMDWLNSNYV
ncbi:MAG: hypothetical protein LBI79_02385 [Nitrososphaerota archaeon]|jgi:uncharacterized membrane protein YfcA|nr:hypothetical protein [Nitrososphaerota archaeon]